MRMTKSVARKLLESIVDVDHRHVDVIQLHRADNLSFNDTNDVILVKLRGRVDNDDSLTSFFRNAIKLGAIKLERYHIGFCSDYEYLAYYASPDVANNIITHVQVYNSAAKMAQPCETGFLASYVLCRGYMDAKEKSLRSLQYEVQQYVRDLVEYATTYVERKPTTRIVLTFNALRLRNEDENISGALDKSHVFDKRKLCILTTELINRRILYRMVNWTNYFQHHITNDLRFLRKLLVDRDLLNAMSWIPPPLLRQIVRAEFRCMFFMHGNSTSYHFAVQQHMFVGRTERRSVDPVTGLIQLRSLMDDHN